MGQQCANKFDDEVANNIISKDYDKQLLNVKQLAQAGNADLWLQLPDVTPRQIPKPYLDIKTPTFTTLSAKQYIKNSAKAKKILRMRGTIMTIGASISLGIMVVIGYVISQMDNSLLAAMFAIFLLPPWFSYGLLCLKGDLNVLT